MSAPARDPEVQRLWRLAAAAPEALRAVHVVRARAAPRFEAAAGVARAQRWDLAGVHQHAVPTIVACLAGVVRLSTANGDRDLRPGELAVLAPAAWHAHAPLRPGSAVLGQGLLLGRSDLVLGGEGRELAVLLPGQPAARLLHALVAADEPRRRLALGRELLAQAGTADAQPVRLHPAAWRMAARLWSGLDRRLRVAEILAAAGVGPRQAHRIFRATFGVPPKAALRAQQLALAAELLREGMGVTAVAVAAGFADRRAFTRAWRQERGAPPSRSRG